MVVLGLKDEFLTLLERDKEFRYAVAGFLGLEEILKRLDRHEEQLVKLGKQFDKADKAIQEPVDKAFKAVLGQIDTRSAKKRFDTEYKLQKGRFFRLKGAKTTEQKNAIETQADKAATAKAPTEAKVESRVSIVSRLLGELA